MDGGVSRRANSVLPHGAGPQPGAARLNGWIDAAVDLYRARSLVPWIQASSASWPNGLEQLLERRGWTIGIDRTLLLGGNLKPTRTTRDVTLQLRLDDRWLNAWWELDGRGGAREQEVASAILARISDRVAFVSVGGGDQVAGVALGVLVDTTLVVECVATAPRVRREGVATAALTALGAWAWEQGSRTTLLAVQETNEAARALYAKLGLLEVGAYSYCRPAVRASQPRPGAG